MKSKKHFDIKTGHYRVLNEGEQTGNNAEQQNQNNQQQQNQPAQHGFKSAETDDQIMSLMKQKQTLINDYNQKIKNEKDNLLKAKETVSKSIQNYSNYSYNPVDVAADILNIENTINKLTKELSDRTATIDDQIIQRKKGLAAEIVKESNNIPEKIKKYYLNESKLNQAKIYLDDVFFNEEYKPIIKTFLDFKRVFVNSDLIYGKDKNGYFVVCADLNDYNQMVSILKALGYEKSDIDTVITPQVFDKMKFVIF